MGNGDSKMSSASYPNLDQKQIAELRVPFIKSSDMKRDPFMISFFFSRIQRFQCWQHRLGGMAGRLFDAVSTNGRIKQEAVLDTANKLCGNADEAASILLKIHGSSKQMLAAVVEAFAASHASSNGGALLHFLYKDDPADDGRLPNYLISNPLTAALIRAVYAPFWNGNSDDLLPKLAGNSTILTSACSLALINAHLPMERRRMWSLLFSSVQHGSSFAQIHKRISGEGSCLVVLRTTEHKVFGCFASDGFLSGPQYRGDATCFLFEIEPQMDIFSATGKSNNYAYLNCQQETLPNGLGMGGCEDIWPFFIHEEYGKGISCRSVSSFEKCCLAGAESFEIKDMEIWRVGRKRQLTIDESDRIRSPKSIIDKDPGAKALLEMSGRTMHSEAYRDSAPMLDDEEEWQKK